MIFKIFSAKFFEEEDVYDEYNQKLSKIGRLSYLCELETGNIVIELEIDSLEDLISLSNELGTGIKLSRPYNEEKHFKLWIIDGYME